MNKIIAIYKQDKSVIIIYPILKTKLSNKTEEEFLQRIYNRAVENNPSFSSLDYEFLNDSSLPSRDSREAWIGQIGSGISIDQTKLDKINSDKLCEQKISEKIRQNSIDELKQSGEIPQDYT